MLIVLVYVHVKPAAVEAFKEATARNAAASRLEPGIARFDVIQQEDEPARFVLVEVYRDLPATQAHKETPHYREWREVVADLMAEPRSSVKYTSISPLDSDW